MSLSTSHVASAEHMLEVVGLEGFLSFGVDLGRSLGDVKISDYKSKLAVLLFTTHQLILLESLKSINSNLLLISLKHALPKTIQIQIHLKRYW